MGVIEELKDVQESINRLNNDYQRIKGRKAQIQSELKERGFNNIKDAKKWVAKTAKDLGEQSSIIKKGLYSLDQKIGELKNGLLPSKRD